MTTEHRAAAAQLRKGVAPYCALALIASGPQYGYDLARSLAEAEVVAGSGSVYPLLARLQSEGLVTAQWHDPPPGGGGLPRKYYALTDAGRAALWDFQRQWTRLAAGVDRLLLLAAGISGGAPNGRA